MANEPKKNIKNKHFFKDFKAELKKVIWPSTKQVTNSTVAVITIVIVTALIVLILDVAFKALNEYGVENLKGAIKTENVVSNELAQNALDILSESELTNSVVQENVIENNV